MSSVTNGVDDTETRQPWVLVLESDAAQAARQVAGLSLALRLALSAQAAAAAAVVVTPALRPLLADRRLALPVLACAPTELRALRMHASCVVHPDHFQCHGGVPGFEPIHVVDAASARLAESKLFDAMGKANDGWLSRWLNRRVSRHISRWLSHTRLTPNQVSLFTLGVGLCAAALTAQGSRAFQVAGAALLQLQSILDGCDGELARVTYRTSREGEWLDTLADNATNYAFFGCAALGLFRQGSPLIYPLAGWVALAVGCTMSAILYRDMLRLETGDVLRHPLLGHATDSRFVRAIRPLFKRDTFLFVLFCAALLDLLGPALVAIAVGAIVLFGQLLRLERAGTVQSMLRARIVKSDSGSIVSSDQPSG